jgi:hypothetical protein
MKSNVALVSSTSHPRPIRQSERRMSISRFMAWQRRVPSTTAVLVRLVRLLSR